MLRYYHTTNAAESILVAGFRDNSGCQSLQGITLTGVFVSEQPLDGDESVAGEEVLEVDLPDDLDLDHYRLVEDGKHYKRWCIPARLLNGLLCRLLAKQEVGSVRDRVTKASSRAQLQTTVTCS
jgi:hypothetical protein